ncbi:NADH-quinone oxidoreductase chain 5 [Paenibacillus konkukensis]|uniref:NADH-quinone oxidoreductase subunit C n=1 Tax=Paenibacillus konkukensis TaxID=2020716 RepID=A0ABY4RRT2_9BACL|nr:NADH-quinone oxidoreductase subunit C [Paenibacillus konkukensis]UQZ84439.1 NADH-quinone oxidoreductase chain 5 [Paenibacillus konkukensis]
MSDEQKKDMLPKADEEAVKPKEAEAAAEEAKPEPEAQASEQPESKAAEAAEAQVQAQQEQKPAASAETPEGAAPAAAAKPDEPGGEAGTEASAKPEAAPRRRARAAADGAEPAAADPGKEPSDAPAAERAVPSDAEKEAKAKAAAEARAARANARAKKPEGEEAAPKQPSPNQPRLDQWIALLKAQHGDAAVEEAFVNEKDGHLPYIVIKSELWPAAAEQLRDDSEFRMNYLRNVSGVDQETHMEVAYHLLALDTKHEVCIKVKTNREAPSIPSVTPIWPTANWNEREIYDLLGIDFPGHPDLRRIMMADDWVGHPLRKDYEPLDPEV